MTVRRSSAQPPPVPTLLLTQEPNPRRTLSGMRDTILQIPKQKTPTTTQCTLHGRHGHMVEARRGLLAGSRRGNISKLTRTRPVRQTGSSAAPGRVETAPIWASSPFLCGSSKIEDRLNPVCRTCTEPTHDWSHPASQGRWGSQGRCSHAQRSQ